MGAKYEAEKRELTIQKLEKEKLLQNETLARKEAESKKQRILLFSFLAGFIIILVFSVFLYRLFVQKKMANVILAQQKEEISAQRDEIETQRDLVTEQKEHIEEIHKEVTDSINYAKRIQEAMLPVLESEKVSRRESEKVSGRESEKVSGRESENQHIVSPSHLPTVPLSQSHTVPLSQSLTFKTFILFKPKDVVSGDFYWFSQVNDYQIYAVADCTGHGVPGAFMSMLGISFLNEIVRKKEVTQASHVLDQLRVSIIDALRQTGGSGTQKDGMDMSLVVIKSQDSNSKLQVPSEKESEKVRQGESEQLADNDTELRSSEMFIEKESDNNPVATTNENQGDSSPCDKDLSSKSQAPNSKSQEEKSEQSSIIDSQFATSTSNFKLQTSNFFQAQWAGANNPLWLIRAVTQSSGLLVEPELRDTDFQNFKNLENLEEHTNRMFVLQEVKPNKMPIAIYERMDKFTNHEIELSKGDTIYLMSDGYEDQFGGEKYKKFMSKRLKEMLVTISEKPMSEQKEILDSTFENWKGEHEQIDDVTILGIKI